MYYDNDPNSSVQLKNQRILSLVKDSPAEACENDPQVKAAFEQSLRELAEDIIQFNPDIAHILLGMSGPSGSADSLHGRN